ncbi:MAG: ADOP family duplicated permease [Bryobacteraceae bacterium]
MRSIYVILHRLRSLFRRSGTEADLRREIEIHFEQLVKEAMASGMSEPEARLMAQRQFGPLEKTKEECRDTRGVSLIENFVRDVRYAMRMLGKNTGFTAVAIITLVLGIAANTTIFSAVSAILLRKPPVKNPDRLCAVSSKAADSDLAWTTAPDFKSWQKQNNAFEAMAAVLTGRSFTLTGKGAPESVPGDRVTPNYFQVTGLMPVLGRPFLPSEAQAGKSDVVILSDGLWRERFGSDPNVIGKKLKINGVPCTIVGVMPPSAESTLEAPQLWAPLVFRPEDSGRGNHYINLVLGRLKPDVSVKQAQAEMSLIAKRLAQRYPKTNKDWGVTVLTLQEYKIRWANVRKSLTLVMTVVGLVLLIACANIAGLLLARGAGRTHELAIRSAMGASRIRLLRQMLVENLLLALTGGGLGLLLSIWGIQLFRAGFHFNEYGSQVAAGFRLDAPTLLFTLAASLVTSLVFGLVPALRASRANPRDALSEGGRTGSGGLGSSRLRSVLVTGEVALALVLVAAAGVMMREIVRQLTEPNGFNPQHLMIASLDANSPRYKDFGTRIALFKQATEKVRNLPGVQDAGLNYCLPMNCSYSRPFAVVGRAPVSQSKLPSANFFVVGPDYFRTMEIPLMKGRNFSFDDNAHGPVVAIVNRKFVQHFFPEGNAIGKQIKVDYGNHNQAQIVGIVGNANTYLGELTPQPQMYESYLQIPFDAWSSMALIVRSRVAPAALAPMLRRAVWSVDKNQVEGRIRTMHGLIDHDMGGRNLMLGLMGIFAGLALVLAAVGIYGVIAYSVAQRTREMGIRVALGAQKNDVLGLVLRQGGLLTAIGCAIGFLLALPLPHLFSGLFDGFAPQGPSVAIAVALLVALVSLLATYVPARRAAKVDPMEALRYE